ncbi:hypothetical protein [Burkholderia sp. BC1]|uniref:hypothetical protein n=1 Tax=Burkholderia sp. BC1 TaxID=1095370 RepID=UPI004043C425|nr:hypothetical protein [Burkholderia multivorans]
MNAKMICAGAEGARVRGYDDMTSPTPAAFHSDRYRHDAHVARIREVRPGLRIHADDATDEFDAVMSGQCSPGLHLVLLLEGALDVSYGERRVVLTTEGRRAVRTRSEIARPAGACSRFCSTRSSRIRSAGGSARVVMRGG